MLQFLYGVQVLSFSFALTSFWAVYCAYRDIGFLAALFTFFFLSMFYGLGPAPMFAAAASILHFRFHVVPLWVPIASYIWAALTLVLQLWLRASIARDAQSGQRKEAS